MLDGLDLADSLGIVRAVIPELDDLHGVEQSHFHHADVHGHTLEVLQELIGLERDLERVFGDELAPRIRAVLDEPLADELTRGQALRFAALLHDIGKPQTRGVRPDGRVTFIGHDAVGQDVIAGITKRLRTSTALREFLGKITRHHLALGFLVHERPLSRAAVYRYLTQDRAGGGRDDAPDLRRPAGHPRAQRRGGDRQAPGPGARADGRGARLPRARARRSRPSAATCWRASWGSTAGRSSASCVERLREAAFTGEATTQDEALQLARRLRHNPAP